MNLSGMRTTSDFLAGLPEHELRFFESIAREVEFAAGQVIFEPEEPADSFYLISRGKVELDLPSSGLVPLVVQTLGPGDLVGVSWLFPPYLWSWRGTAPVNTGAVVFDAAAVRHEVELNHDLGLRLFKAITAIAVKRLHGTRLQMLNLYETA